MVFGQSNHQRLHRGGVLPAQPFVWRLMKPLGYLDVYDKLRQWQQELAVIRENVEGHMTNESRYALATLNGVFYLVEGQLVLDGDGAN
jgi:hypothetical protein